MFLPLKSYIKAALLSPIDPNDEEQFQSFIKQLSVCETEEQLNDYVVNLVTDRLDEYEEEPIVTISEKEAVDEVRELEALVTAGKEEKVAEPPPVAKVDNDIIHIVAAATEIIKGNGYVFVGEEAFLGSELFTILKENYDIDDISPRVRGRIFSSLGYTSIGTSNFSGAIPDSQVAYSKIDSEIKTIKEARAYFAERGKEDDDE